MATRTDPATPLTADGLKYLPPERESAFFGFLQAHVDLIRSIEGALHGAHDVSLAGYEVLNRLAQSGEAGGLRISDLADRTRLSLSRISRVVDDLALRGLVERRACATDRRVSYAALTPDGLAFLRDAQDTFHTVVEERFLGRLSADEMRVLADVFGRLAERDGECRTALASPSDA